MVSKRNTSKILCSILRVPCIDKREYIWYSEKQLVLMAVRTHLYPYRTQKLSSPASKILGWRRPGKIERCQHKRKRTGETVRFVYSSLAQSVEHAAVNRRVVCSSQTGGAKHLLGCVVCPERGVRGKLYMKSGPLAQLVRATGS